MGEIEAPQQIKQDVQALIPDHHDSSSSTAASDQLSVIVKRRKWWFLVAICITFLLIGQSSAKILQHIYYKQGGDSTWMRAVVKTGAFPVLILPLLFFFNSNSPKNPPTNDNNIKISVNKPSMFAQCLVYFSLGVLLAAESMLHSVGILYLPLSVFSLISASQLPFNVVFFFLINRKKFTLLIIISIFLVTLSCCSIGIFGYPFEGKPEDSYYDTNYVTGSWCTVFASLVYSLYLSLMQLSFEKVILKEKKKKKEVKREFGLVLKMQIYTSLVSTLICLVGFLVTEVNGMKSEMEGFHKGRRAYVLTLVGAALAWQIGSIGLVGLVFWVSSLFSNVVSMLPLPFLTIFAAMYYNKTDNDGFQNMNWVKIVAMFVVLLGFSSYLYQLHRGDDKKPKKKDSKENDDIGQV